jgi:hypothetical protein
MQNLGSVYIWGSPFVEIIFKISNSIIYTRKVSKEGYSLFHVETGLN